MTDNNTSGFVEGASFDNLLPRRGELIGSYKLNDIQGRSLGPLDERKLKRYLRPEGSDDNVIQGRSTSTTYDSQVNPSPSVGTYSIGNPLEKRSDFLKNDYQYSRSIVNQTPLDKQGVTNKVIPPINMNAIEITTAPLPDEPPTKEDLIHIKSHRKINPGGKFALIWDFLVILLSLYQIIIVPVEVGFSTGFIPGWWFQDAITGFFLVDIFLNFRRGYYKDGFVVYNSNKIAKHYLKRTFIFDLIATFPYRWIAKVSGQPNPYTTPNLWALFRILTLFRVIRLREALRNYRISLRIYNRLYYFIAFVCTYLLIAHIFACFFFFIGDYENFHGENSWIATFGVVGLPVYLQYLKSFYWAISTMVTTGYGDLTPITNVEQLFTAITMVITPCIYFAGIIAIQQFFFPMNGLSGPALKKGVDGRGLECTNISAKSVETSEGTYIIARLNFKARRLQKANYRILMKVYSGENCLFPSLHSIPSDYLTQPEFKLAVTAINDLRPPDLNVHISIWLDNNGTHDLIQSTARIPCERIRHL